VGKEVIRPWGKYQVIFRGSAFLIKIITINPKCRISLQYHKHRDEFWYILDGKGVVTRNGKISLVKPKKCVIITRNMQHRIYNDSDGDNNLVFLEIQTGIIKLDEHDIVRIRDDYGR